MIMNKLGILKNFTMPAYTGQSLALWHRGVKLFISLRNSSHFTVFSQCQMFTFFYRFWLFLQFFQSATMPLPIGLVL